MSTPPSLPKIYGLTPIFNKKGLLQCWNVGLVRRGQRISGSFAVRKHGGIELAMQAALAFRDQALERLRPLAMQEFMTIVRRNNSSGVPGVLRTSSERWPCWCAIIYLPDGRTRKRSFAVLKHGEEQAKALAVAARLELLEQVSNWFKPDSEGLAHGQHHLPTLPQACAIPSARTVQNHQAKPRKPLEEQHVFRMTDTRPRVGGFGCGAWCAEHKLPDGGFVRKKFSVHSHGEEVAHQMALAQRAAWLKTPPSRRHRKERATTPGDQVPAVKPRPPAAGTPSDPAPTSSH